MKKIKEIVKINSGYTSYVDLHEDYYDLEKNRGRMQRYKPIAAHRQVFEKISNALNPLDRRFYFLSGSYGTGKSHLLLMFANYFASPSDVPEIEAFFENYEASQNEVLLKPGEMLKEKKAATLKEARKSGRYLVALCRYSLNLDFEGTLLRALQEALQKDESNILFDSHYLEALRRISDWESRRDETRFFTDLEIAISKLYPDWTVNDLIDGLENYDEQALKAFKNCFRTVTDTDFSYNKDNLRDIISDFLKNPEFKQKYKGIVFLYDEFGASIDANYVDYTTLLDFSQYCANSTLEKGGTVVFIGTGHKGFRFHGKVGDLTAETLEARVMEISLVTEGMEDIIAAIVQPDKSSAEWEKYIQPRSGNFTFFSVECNRLNLFNWLPAPKIKNNIIQNIYPMHPMATFALLKLAREAGSDNRSVIKFFAPEFETGEEGWANVQPYSYPWFLENNEIIHQNKLSLYTADLLVDYFKESLKTTNNRLVDNVKNSVINYEATLRELNAYFARKPQQPLFDEMDELIPRIIKVIVVNEIASSSDVSIVNTAQNIEFALNYFSPEEKAQVEERLKLLCKAAVLYDNKGVYELIPGDRKDVQRLVDQYKSNPDNRPTNLLQSFLDLNPLANDEVFLEAKDYNAVYNEDKRLKVVFATAKMLSQEQILNGVTYSFFDTLEQERLQVFRNANGYEGVAVYAFCENDQDIELVKKIIRNNSQQRIVIAVPRNPINLDDAVYTLKALKSDWFKTQAQDFGSFENAELLRIRNQAKTALEDAKKTYFTNTKVYWFGKNGAEIPINESKPYDIANRLIHDLYSSKRNTFGHNEFNKAHINLTGRVLAIFKEAGDILVNLSQPIRVNWSWPENYGGNKYLRKCFVDHQVLKIQSIEGDVRYLVPEKEINKFLLAIPAYAKLLEDLASLENKGAINLNLFLKPYFEEYGQGQIAIILMMLLARRFYGDSLRFKREPNNLTDIKFVQTDDMISLVQGQYPSAVLLFEPVSSQDQQYFAIITQTFTNQPAPAGKVYSIQEAFEATTSWWDSLPIIARSLGFYSAEEKPLAEAFSQLKTKDPFRFIKYELLELLDQTPGVVLTTAKLNHIEVFLRAFKSHAEAIQANVESQILSRVADLFELKSHLDVDIQDAFKNWHNQLSITQKDPLGTYHNNDSKPLVKFTYYTNIRELLFETLPEAYSLGHVKTWMNDYVDNYILRIQKGINHIEKMAPPPIILIVEFSNAISQNGDQVTFREELILHTETGDGKGIIYYTEDGSDPSTNKRAKTMLPGDTLTIKGNKKLKMVVADEKGYYGTVETIEAINELEKYKIVRPKQMSAHDETITFVFPKEKGAARITLISLLSELTKANVFSISELRQVLSQVLDELEK